MTVIKRVIFSANTYKKSYLVVSALGVLLIGMYSLYMTEALVYFDVFISPRVTPVSNHRRISWAGANEMKTILLWTPYYQSPYYGFGAGSSGFQNENYGCHVQTCALTDDRSALATADAVLFHGAEIRRDPPLPTRGHSRQVFVFLVYESPWSVRQIRIANLSAVFNLTMTYMDDSLTDIHVPYGVVIPRPQPLPEAAPWAAQLQAKSRVVAWLVSNCHSISSRAEYAQQLARHVQVDVYGRCGNFSCPKANASCLNQLVRDHMFMLAFENSYCTDYMTEKLFRALRADIVPITLGRVNYAKYLPPKSFIDVRDFNSPRHLAEYLLYLEQNRTAYGEYFRWKRTHVAMERGYTRPRAFCRLCEILHDPSYSYRTDFNLSHYWGRDRNCLNGTAERRDVHLIP